MGATKTELPSDLEEVDVIVAGGESKMPTEFA